MNVHISCADICIYRKVMHICSSVIFQFRFTSIIHQVGSFLFALFRLFAGRWAMGDFFVLRFWFELLIGPKVYPRGIDRVFVWYGGA